MDKPLINFHLKAVHGNIEKKKEKSSLENEYQKSKVKTIQDYSFECHICDKKLNSNASLKCHIASLHEGEKSYKCEVCNADFSTKQNLD